MGDSEIVAEGSTPRAREPDELEKLLMNLSPREREGLDRWLDGMKPNTRAVLLRNWKAFYDWLQDHGPRELVGLSPMELVRKQKALNRAFILDEILLPEKKVILGAVLNYVNNPYPNREDFEGWRSTYKRKIYSSVRSLFTFYLDKEGFPSLANGEKGRLKGEPKARKELRIKGVKEILDNSNAMYKAVWSCMLAGGMGIKEVLKFSNMGVEFCREALANPIMRDGEPLIELYLPARKMNEIEDFYTYIGGSALDYLRDWMKHRDDMEARFKSAEMREERARYYRKREKEAPPLPEAFPDALFVNNTYRPLTRKAAQFYWTSQLKQLKKFKSMGRRSTRTNMNMHQIRSVFRTRGHKSKADRDLLEYFMGHKVDALDYNQIAADRDYRIEEYLKVLPWVDVRKIDIEAQSERVKELEKLLEDYRGLFKEIEGKIFVGTGKGIEAVIAGDDTVALIKRDREREKRRDEDYARELEEKARRNRERV